MKCKGDVAENAVPEFSNKVGFIDKFMRVPLIIGAGTGWSATSPLHLTLQCANKCSHAGILKEDHLLSHIHSKNAWKWRKQWYEKLITDSMVPVWDKPYGMKNKYAFHQNIDEIHELFQKPTLETYIKYYTRHYHRVKHEYSYVHDFSNSNASLPLDFLQKIAPELRKYFKIKVLIIFRDPVRRLYSELSHHYQNDENLRKKYPTSKDYFWSYLKIGDYSINCEFVKRIKYYKSIFSTTTIVSEDLWGGKNESLAKLSKFLQFDIKNLWPNCYYPEMGTKAPKHEYLQDQWHSDMEDLTHDDMVYGRKYLAKYYDQWYNEFGTTPWRC